MQIRKRIHTIVIAFTLLPLLIIAPACSPKATADASLRFDFPQVMCMHQLSAMIELAPDATLPAETELMVYSIVDPEVTTEYVEQVGSALGFSGDAIPIDPESSINMLDESGEYTRVLRIYTSGRTGMLDYDVMVSSVPETEPVMPSDEDCIQMANDFLTDAGLMPAEAELDRVFDQETMGSHGPEGLIYEWVLKKAVVYKRTIDDRPVQGDKLLVQIAEEGIIGCMKSWRDVESHKTQPLKTVAAAIDDYKAESLHGMWSTQADTETIAKIVIDEVELCYWMDVPAAYQQYCAPVYQLTGKCLDASGTNVGEITVWCEALAF